MRHYVAVRDERGRWFYANEGRHRQTGHYGWTPSGACSPHISCPDCGHLPYMSETQKACKTCGGGAMVDSPTPCQGHDTAEEAYEHERQRKLDHVRFYPDREDPRELHRCEIEGCKTFTSGSAHIGGWFSMFVCEEHRNRESIEPLFHVGESWES